ncbi:hypothetical protein MVEN_02608200 [Mycena venus]|uniref:Peptidase C14 caspase domain-containing protein n=1 Tax=Mycena venus TaxID=2733690 RepID=A0A8H6TZE2_9AGAR|nr:hypothetical protein MVEN_02608200 [Mycena venus]
MTTPTNIAGITTSGIQDVSALLPLLGTEQCEEHVSSALDRGFFYAAGAPISIFGSLGIVKAGFAAVWVSLDVWHFHGPRQMRNAGFSPKGVMGKLAYALDTDDSIYVAEAQLRSILQRYQTIDVDVDLLSWPWIQWNLLVLLFGIAFGSMGLLPYVYIIRLNFSDRPFRETWMYPVLRIFGCVLVTTMIQLVVQLRILFIVQSRLRFHALSSWFREHGKVPPVSWNGDARSEDCLSRLAEDIKRSANDTHDVRYEYARMVKESVADEDLSALYKTKTSERILLALCRLLLLGGMAAIGVGYVGCFGLVQASSAVVKGPGLWLAVEIILCIVRLGIWASNPSFDDPPPPIAIRKSHGEGRNRKSYDINIGWMLESVTVDDLHAVVVGIDKLKDNGLGGIPELGSAVKDAKSVARYLQDRLAVPEGQITSLYDDAATSTVIEGAIRRLATDPSIRPGAPMVLYFACHTTDNGGPSLTVAPKGSTTAHDSSSTKPDATIRSRGKITNTTSGKPRPRPAPPRDLLFVTYDFDKDAPVQGLLYAKFLDLLQTIAIAKGNNITVILDTCYSGQLGAQNPPQEFRNSHSSHVLLAACSTDETAQETEEGGVFTRALLKQLGTVAANVTPTSLWEQIKNTLTKCSPQASPRDIRKLTYRGLIDTIREDPEIVKFRQTPLCSGYFQDTLLFNGLISRRRLGEASENSSVILISSEHDVVDMKKNKEEV